ncbi:MAG: bifunctional glutamate N-acetyltransferase/amino-acid acetyltransferase ArgJ [Ruminococcus sp.]|jgi:glutamate N-acetyltransferase/amino-acid N-acetyltransferase|nr:bifunctional glutamate N-acetyltransferase/amino-acid acetyltransferase ArgJ [Ruminococcus sp.]
MNITKGGVCAAKGFKASGVYAGVKDNPTGKFDLALVASDIPADTAAVFTKNKVKAAPVLVSIDNLKKTGGIINAVILNSKNANACVHDGIETAKAMCKATAEKLKIDTEKVLVCSTGVIGQSLPIDKITAAVPTLIGKLSENGNADAATAIMTTDTFKKEYAVEFTLDGKACRIGGMAKGSGMIAPNMATTLNVITSDVKISPDLLRTALSDVTEKTYNCLYIDGDMSTNDTIILMANGLAANKFIDSVNADYESFKNALFEVMKNLTIMLAKDGEGASKLLTANVTGAPSFEVGKTVAKSIIGSDLLKCAMFGEDANWGRILCAIGYAPADIEISPIEVSLASKRGEIAVCKNGEGLNFSEETAADILSEYEIEINVNLHQGSESATAWGCDLTYDYVKINGDYRS